MQQTVTPKPAASLILLRGSPENPEVLLGKRRHDLRFMPGYAVFPGGRVDIEDTESARFLGMDVTDLQGIRDDLSGQDYIAHCLAACRECIEETGYLPIDNAKVDKDVEHPYLTACRDQNSGVLNLPLPCVAQAITPEGSPVRFNARFFVHIVKEIPRPFKPEGELIEIDWYNVKDALKTLPIADVTEFALKESLTYYQTGLLPDLPPLLTYSYDDYSVIIDREPEL
ncbi:NUDIX hydrolase [Curvivirga sp.]|uniref:NUDIX hydrolase n=1 Tax=Curvivirga sp. TaxID=2856848 RepID=UPI003B5B35EF